MGIVSARKPLPLAVGSSVHAGLAILLKEGQRSISRPDSVTWPQIEDYGVEVALKDFAQYESAIDVDTGEIASRASLPADAPALSEMNEYLYREQCALVESMVRAYSRRRLRPLLEQFQVLEVEREGEWLLYHNLETAQEARARGATMYNIGATEADDWEIVFMSRPDALLRERESNQLYLLSFKTTAAWDIRKARDAEHDMQGMSEGIEIERRLGAWWHAMDKKEDHIGDVAFQEVHGNPGPSLAMLHYLRGLDAPPRILAVRYEFLLKGQRWKDKELSARFACDMYSQKSHLIRQYVATSVPMRGSAGYNIGDTCWSWEYIRDDGKESNLAWQNWKSRPIFDEGNIRTSGSIKQWIDALDTAAETMSGEDSTVGMEPRLLGYKCDAQAVGVTREHPLDACFVPPIVIYRNEDELRDLVEQMEAVERRVAEGVAAVHAAADEGERRHQLNQHFVMNRHACEFPSTCFASKLCFGSDAIRRDPVGSGLYKIRIPNHPIEGANHE